MAFFDHLAVLYDIDRDPRIDISEDGKIEIKLRVDLDYILFAHLQAVYVLYYRHGAVKLAEFENTVYFHALSRADMVEDDSVLYRINVHFPPPKEA